MESGCDLANRDIIKCHDGIQIGGDDYMALTDLGRVCPVAMGDVGDDQITRGFDIVI